MMNRRTLSRLAVFLVLLVALALLLTGCGADTPKNTFAPGGEVARDQRNLFYLAMWPAIVVMIFVELGLVVTLLRFRRRRAEDVPKQVHGNTKLELAWTIAPAILLLVLAVPMMSLLFKLGREPHADDFVVNVTGVQWQWLFEYPGLKGPDGSTLKSAPGDPVIFPAGQEIRFNVTSVDVIHSFWIPRLGGKLDAVPSRQNRFWLKADQPGTWSGQCSEFCGKDHANMKLVAEALSQADFDAWLKEKQAGAKAQNGAAAAVSTAAQ